MQQAFGFAVCNINHMVLCLIFLAPKYPTINTHNGIIQVNACLPEQMNTKAEINEYGGIDKPDGKYKYVFLTCIPYAYNACNNGNEFQ